MFDSLDEAIKFSKNDEDGGLPFFRWEAVEVKGSDPVEYENVAWVTIINKGDTKTVIETPKLPAHEKRWPAQWKAFIEGTEAPLEGVPLKEFPALTPADIATCHRYHIRTVEDLSKYPDGQIKNLGGRGVSLKNQAVKFLEYRQGPDIDELKAQIERLEKLVGDNISDVPKRAAGNRVSKPRNTVRKQQSRRKTNKADSKDSGDKAG
jgi:hypothetical protein